MVIDILKRLPVKSLAKFLLISKLWSRIILSQDLIISFMSQSSLLQPRILFAFKDLDNQNNKKIWNFFSSSSTSKLITYNFSLTTSSNFFSSLSCHAYINEVPHYVNGLISLGCGEEQIICNPSTGQSLLLPKVEWGKQIIRSFFGYDPVDGRYKVLCMSGNVYDYFRHAEYFEHHVFTLGGDCIPWRMIKCEIIHRPKTNGICINGVVYYGALMETRTSEWCIVRFDVRSEKFDQVVEFMGDPSPPSLDDYREPSLINYRQPSLISYKGKVTLAIEIEQLRFELWVLEDAEKHEWSKVCFSVQHPWMDLLGHFFGLGGDITHTDEIVFVLHKPGYFYFVYYDHKKDIFRNVVEVRLNSCKNFKWFSVMVPIFNYIDSDMLL